MGISSRVFVGVSWLFMFLVTADRVYLCFRSFSVYTCVTCKYLCRIEDTEYFVSAFHA